MFRMGVHALLAVFFFIIWIGPGKRRAAWMFGVFLLTLGFWAGVGDAVSNAIVIWLLPEPPAQFWTWLSVELASLSILLFILYLYLSKLCRESLRQQARLERANSGLHAGLDVAAQLIIDSTEAV